MRKRIEVHGKPIAGGVLPLVCAPLVGKNPDGLLVEARLVAAKRPDLVEWRIDHYEPIASLAAVLASARALRQTLGETPIILTRRSAMEGGRPVPISEPAVLELYEAVCRSGCVDLVDYELANAREHVARVREMARRHGVALILSFHDFARTPPVDVLRQSFLDAERAGADVAKIAVTPRCLEDVLTLLAATLEADRLLGIPLLSMSMGPYGSLTRVCGWMFGSTLTFASGVESSAPGQLPIDELRAAIEILRRAAIWSQGDPEAGDP